MKNFKRFLSALLLVCMALSCLAACGGETEPAETDPQFIDYADTLKLDMTSETKKLEVTVKTYVDGDTVHFNANDDTFEDHVLKARFLAVDTPESTGKIEQYGKKASKFTKEALSQAVSIIVESDDANWNPDSTGSRFMVWIWYKTSEDGDYRNLNLELLQNGLSVASNTSSNRYGEICMEALNQAKDFALNLFSGEQDPDFYYGDAVELTLKELRTNVEAYNGITVAFSGVITMNDNNTIYVEDYDAETDTYYGMSVYLGYNLTGAGLEIVNVGNESRIVGTVQYYETGGTWQVSGLSYRAMKPDDPNNVQLISEGNDPAFALIDADSFANKTVELEVAGEIKTFRYAELLLSTSVEVKDLTVVSVYTTASGSSKGAMTLTCECDGITVTVRTAVLYDENGELVTEDAFLGKTISVKGIVDYYSDSYGGKDPYQVKVLTVDHITVND